MPRGKPTERHAAEQNGPDVRIVDHSEGGTATPGPTRRRVWPEREEPGHYLNRGVAVGNPNEPALPDPCQVAGGEGQEDMTEEGRLHRGHREAQSPAHIGDEAVVGNAETRHRIDGYQDGEQNHQPAHAPVRAEPARHPADGCPDGHVRDGRQDESPARAGPQTAGSTTSIATATGTAASSAGTPRAAGSGAWPGAGDEPFIPSGRQRPRA